jgi:hypothetical protein
MVSLLGLHDAWREPNLTPRKNKLVSTLVFTASFRNKIAGWLIMSGVIRGTIKISTHIFWQDLLIQFFVISTITS